MLTDRQVETLRPVIARRLGRLTCSRDLIDDVTQDVLTKLTVRDLTDIENLRGLACRTAERVFIEHFRKRKAVLASELDVNPFDQGEDLGSLREIAAFMCRSDLVRATLELPQSQRQVVLILMEDPDQEAAAKTLNIPLGTVKSRLHRARKNLRQLLAVA